jgi:SAM-dependent methyltransferase
VRGVGVRVANAVSGLRSPRPANVAARPVAPFRTFFDAAPTRAFIEKWSVTRPEQLDSPYFNTHAGRFAFIAEVIRLLGLTGSCLDVGGTSRSMQALEELTSLSAIQMTSEVDLEIDPWADAAGLEKYELAIFSEVVEHLNADPARAFHEINRCLAPGGYLLLTTVNIASELGIYNIVRGEAPYAMSNIFGKRGDRHQREYAPKELQRLVAAHGFETWAFTVNVYPEARAKRQAHEWIRRAMPSAGDHLHGDTIVVLGRKVEASKQPRWIHPVYHASIAENPTEAVPEDVAALVRDGFPPQLKEFLEAHAAS